MIINYCGGGIVTDARLINEGMKKELKKRIQRVENKLEEARRVSRNGNIFEKIRAKSTISDLQKDLSKLTMFEQDFSKFYTETNDNSYELPIEVKSQIERLSEVLNENESISLSSELKSVLYTENYTKNARDIKESSQKLLSDSEAIFKSGNFIYVEREGNYTVKNLISELEKQKKEELKNKYERNEFGLEKGNLSFSEIDPKSMEIDKMIRSTDKFDTKEMQTIKNNYSKIKANQANKKRAEKVLEQIDLVITSVVDEMKVSGVDFTKVVSSLENIKSNATKSLKEANAFLSSFDLNIIEQELKKYKEKGIQVDDRNKYMELAYEREKAISEGNLSKASQIRESMIAMGDKYSDSEINRMQEQMKNQLFNDQMVESIKENEKVKNSKLKPIEERIMMEEGRKEQAFSERDKVIRNGEAHLRDLAMEKLINDGVQLQFDEEKDAYLIHKEIEKMKQIAGMTPSERAKADGVTNPNDIVFYSDEFMGFDVKDFKNTDKMLQDNMKAQATSIYKDYIRYYASQKDKKEAMKFSEFAARSYGYIDMNEQMVEDDVIKEGRSR